MKGRPSSYNPKIAKEICDKIASCGKGLKRLCRENEHWPCHETIYNWLRKYPNFFDLYAKAKKDQVTALVEEILEISDDSSHDVLVKEDRDGNEYEVCNTEFVQRSRLRVDTRKWIASKLVPRLYGDNILARELADEMKEFREMLESKKSKEELNYGKAMDSKSD